MNESIRSGSIAGLLVLIILYMRFPIKVIQIVMYFVV